MRKGLIACFILLPLRALGAEPTGHFRAEVGSEVFVFQQSGSSLQTIEGAARFSYGFSEKWLTSLAIGQAFSTTTLGTTVYTRFAVQADYALHGRTSRRTRIIRFGDDDTARTRPMYHGAFLVGLRLSQFFFHGVASTLSFSGPGLALTYELPTGADYSFKVSGAVDRIANRTSSIFAFSGGVSLLFWF